MPNTPSMPADELVTAHTVADLGRLLRQLRRRDARQRGDAELTYRQLAALTGWSHSSIGHYFAGKIVPPTDRFDNLIQLLGASPAEQRLFATARDRAEESTRSRPSEPVAMVIRQLPADLHGFVGRHAAAAELEALLDSQRDTPAVVISAVSGMAGVGKTTLAVHWAHRIAHRFPDGQLYLNLRGFDRSGTAMTPAEALRSFLDAFEVPPARIPADVHARAALYRSLIAHRKMLVLLDNARDAEQVRPLLPGAAGAMVVITSRDRLASLVATANAHVLTVELLPPDEAHQMLAQRLGTTRLSAEPEAAEQIIACCAGLPLALSIVAARAAIQPALRLASLVAELQDIGGGLAVLAGDDPVTDLRTVFSWSYQRLDSGAARLFRLLGIHPGIDIGVSAAASLAGVAVPVAADLLARLAQAHLLQEHRADRYTMHDLVRAYAAELCHGSDDPDEGHAALARVLDHYAHTAHEASRLLYPYRDPVLLKPPATGAVAHPLGSTEQATAWLVAEQHVLIAAVSCAADSGLEQRAWHLIRAISPFLDLRGRWDDWISANHIALAAAERQADPRAQAHIHRELGIAFLRRQRFDEAEVHLHRSLELSIGVDDPIGCAHAQHTLGFVSAQRGDLSAALDFSHQALKAYRGSGHQSGEAKSLNAIGWFHAQRGEHREAILHCEQAINALDVIGDRLGIAHTLDSLGYAYHQLGEHGLAADYFQRSLDLFRHLGDVLHEAEVLAHLGEARAAQGDPGRAREHRQRAIEIFDRLGHVEDADRLRNRSY